MASCNSSSFFQEYVGTECEKNKYSIPKALKSVTSLSASLRLRSTHWMKPEIKNWDQAQIQERKLPKFLRLATQDRKKMDDQLITRAPLTLLLDQSVLIIARVLGMRVDLEFSRQFQKLLNDCWTLLVYNSGKYVSDSSSNINLLGLTA